MQGYVLSVRPLSGEAVIIGDSGETFRCSSPELTSRLEGGDLVAFDPPPQMDSLKRFRILARGTDRAAVGNATGLSDLADILQLGSRV